VEIAEGRACSVKEAISSGSCCGFCTVRLCRPFPFRFRHFRMGSCNDMCSLVRQFGNCVLVGQSKEDKVLVLEVGRCIFAMHDCKLQVVSWPIIKLSLPQAFTL